MEYQTVFDISMQRHAVWPLLAGLLAVAILLPLCVVGPGRRGIAAGSVAGVAVMLLLALAAGGLRYRELAALQATLAGGAGAVVEGEIRGFWTNRPRADAPGPMRTYETFRVGDAVFQYYLETDAAGFHNAGDEPLRLRDGNRVRIHFAADPVPGGPRNRILRLEIAEPDVLAVAGEVGAPITLARAGLEVEPQRRPSGTAALQPQR